MDKFFLEQSIPEAKVWVSKNWNTVELNFFFRNLCLDDIDNYHHNTIWKKRNSLIKFTKQQFNLSTDILVKQFGNNRIFDKIRFCFIRSKAYRALKVAAKLETININTPQPVAAIEQRSFFNVLKKSYYITEYIPCMHSLYDIINSSDQELRGKLAVILPYIAKDIRKMHDAGIIHNDLSSRNILIEKIDNHPKFYFIDLNRCRIKNKLSVRQRMKDLARLRLTKEEIKLFAINYDPNNYKKLILKITKEQEKRQNYLLFKSKIFKNKDLNE